jgi:hypothetical protein
VTEEGKTTLTDEEILTAGPGGRPLATFDDDSTDSDTGDDTDSTDDSDATDADSDDA